MTSSPAFLIGLGALLLGIVVLNKLAFRWWAVAVVFACLTLLSVVLKDLG